MSPQLQNSLTNFIALLLVVFQSCMKFSYPERLKVSNPAPLHNKKNDATDDGDSQTADMLLCID
ncbi:hypothetical protein T4B_14712 [Trichinella pseudospiralis]|uniref:Uncharacterized protein n=1 Tax=Trichinella pseudospiralis TaxID=6337 RepID=A0A0V1K7U5_TRIPS|nr:hypothetical protein T4A_3882 [Trichinella pseudospiralis]KRZ31103.1 hypothetical protein T4B_14712 [Trichinella pseudospiralis]KRZ43290.1 hypothetical protein T4C_5642 [Trichinella pseudospiralis]